MTTNFIVTEAAQRPARKDGTCFYCNQPIGSPHNPDCALISKRVQIRMIVEYPVTVPAGWAKSDVEFFRNSSRWCANNALDELAALTENDACICNCTRFEYIEDVSLPFLDE